MIDWTLGGATVVGSWVVEKRFVALMETDLFTYGASRPSGTEGV